MLDKKLNTEAEGLHVLKKIWRDCQLNWISCQSGPPPPPPTAQAPGRRERERGADDDNITVTESVRPGVATRPGDIISCQVKGNIWYKEFYSDPHLSPLSTLFIIYSYSYIRSGSVNGRQSLLYYIHYTLYFNITYFTTKSIIFYSLRILLI